ncbi:MAG TPA: glycosyltransferase [Pyrinomonadaceae bacterium]|nr:glycosyltransferase [Pyrinomonadaceae bacterium]
MKNVTDLIDSDSYFGKYLKSTRKLKAETPFFWDHHRGGWGYVGKVINAQLHTPDGVAYFSSVEHELLQRHLDNKGPIKEPWVGFMHQMPHHDLKFWDLARIVQHDIWKESIRYCRGLWTLTDYQKSFLEELNVPVPVSKVYYPVEVPDLNFSWEKFLANQTRQIFCIGMYLRNFQAFYELEVPGFEKVLLKYPNFDRDLTTGRLSLDMNDSVSALEMVSVAEYDELLARNIVFLSLEDAGAVTTVIECIVRGTPVLVNPVGGVIEYLGPNYPLYYDTLAEAERKAQDFELIKSAAEYLENHELKEKLTPEYFLASLQNTAVYRMLPVPASQQTQFETVDVSIVMCAYKRIQSLETQLTLLTQQDFAGAFEVLIWNNNAETAQEVDRICAPFKERLRLKVIHSSENFYCIIRLAVASLIRSDLLLICDDDVLPQPNYISKFLSKYEEYGPNAVLCARGHVFLPHELDLDNPDRVWRNRESMVFYDERQSDRQIHFTHADNCLIPKSLMKQALQYEMEHYEFALVDDYWLAYVFSKHLEVPLWKIKMDDALQFTECANDPSIAMFHNQLVNEQRVNFYIYHMTHGWPFDAASSAAADLPRTQDAEVVMAETSD